VVSRAFTVLRPGARAQPFFKTNFRFPVTVTVTVSTVTAASSLLSRSFFINLSYFFFAIQS
jgi:hypothetical protein